MRPVYLGRIERRIFASSPSTSQVLGVLLAVALGIFFALFLVHYAAK